MSFEKFDPDHRYWFYDRTQHAVGSTDGYVLDADDPNYLTNGRCRVLISDLRSDKVHALADGVEQLKSEIAKLCEILGGLRIEFRDELGNLKHIQSVKQ